MTARSQEEQLTRPPDGALVLVIGNLTIDDVVLPTGVTHMGMLGGNSVHAATAVVTAGAKAALVARRGEDFPPGALAALADAGIDLTGLADIPGPTVRSKRRAPSRSLVWQGQQPASTTACVPHSVSSTSSSCGKAAWPRSLPWRPKARSFSGVSGRSFVLPSRAISRQPL